MKCSQCNADLSESVQFCSECGARVAPVQEQPAVQPAPPVQAAPPAQATPATASAVQVQGITLKTVTPILIAYLACSALLIVSAFLTWERITLNGYEVGTGSGFDANRGWFVFIAGWGALGMAVATMFRDEPVRGLRLAMFGAAGVAIVMAIIEFTNAGENCGVGSTTNFDFSNIDFSGDGPAIDSTDVCAKVAPGIGSFTALLGGIALAAFAWFRGGSKPAARIQEAEATA